jgi:hypothetical protein
MRRLILCSVVALSPLFLASCSGDPTDSLRNGVDKLNPSPSQVFLQQGKTKNVDVTATDDQGNQIETAFAITNVGPGVTVERDPAFRTVFVNDSQLALPATDAMFRYRVTANQLVSSSFTITAEGHDVVVPVNVTPDPLLIPQAAVSTSGPAPQDTITLTLPAPYAFQGTAAVAFDVGNAVVVGRSPDGLALKVLALPGSTGAGAITGVNIDYLPTVPLATSTDTTTPVAVNTTVTAMPGTTDPATAPVITLPAAGEQTGFIDAGLNSAAACGGNSGFPCQLYRFSLADSTALHVRLQGEGTADLGLYFINAADGTDADQACDALGRAEAPEECDLEFGAGDYLMAVVSFGPGYPENDPNPAWIAVQIGVQ